MEVCYVWSTFKKHHSRCRSFRIQLASTSRWKRRTFASRGDSGTRGRSPYSSRSPRSRQHLPRLADPSSHHPLLLVVVLALLHPSYRASLAARILLFAESEQDAGDLQGLPGLHDQHVSFEPRRVLDGHRLQAEPRWRRRGDHARARILGTMGTDQLSGAPHVPPSCVQR